MSDSNRDLSATDRDSNYSSASEIPEFQIVIKSESVESSTSTSTTDTIAHPQQSSSSTTTNPEVQSTSSSGDKEDNKNSRLLNSIVYTGEFLVPKIEKQSHLKRLQNLRKEISYIKDTEWMYDPVE